MKQTTLTLLLGLAGIFVAGNCIGQATEKYNLDFEEVNQKMQLPQGWGLGNITGVIPIRPDTVHFKSDRTIKHSGTASLLINWPEGSGEWTSSAYTINKTFEGKTIKLTGYVKTEDVTSAGLWLRVDGKDGNYLAFDNMADRSIKGTTDWKQYTIELDYDAKNVKGIVLGGLLEGKGKMWMDDLQMTIDGKDISTLHGYKPVLAKADADTAFDNGSGIANITLDDRKIKELANLGAIWGFLKYYHSSVAAGDFNMDAALYRVLSAVLSAGTEAAAYNVMDKWVDGFGLHTGCKGCKPAKTIKPAHAADYGDLFKTGNLPEPLRLKLQAIKDTRYEVKDHYYIDQVNGVNNPVFKNEPAYEGHEYPDAGTRLLALYRYWNMIQYFFPYRHLIGEDWNKVLPEFIPKFVSAKDSLGYSLACMELIARIHDTHANIWGGAKAIDVWKGENVAPFRATFIENELVANGYYKDTLGIKNKIHPGDIIEKINGQTVAELVKKYLPLAAASNYETQLRDLPLRFLLRTKDSVFRLSVLQNGMRADITVPAIKMTRDVAMASYTMDAPKEAYRNLTGSIGYIYPALLKDGDIDIIRKQMAGTKGLIIDMRCYPSSFMPFTYGSWLKAKKSPFVKFTTPDLDAPGNFLNDATIENGGAGKDGYKGKVVIIVNEKTVSQAEYTTMALGNMPNATVIGSTTAGADGNVSTIVLPGGITSMISGIEVLYPDGTETQRKGIKIDKVLHPTIEGIKSGRDELLEEAIKIAGTK